MKIDHAVVFLVSLVAGTLVGCASAPLPSPIAGTRLEVSSPTPAYQRPPSRMFGIMQEQGSLEAVPEVAEMVAYQQQRKLQREALPATVLAAPQWSDLGPANNLGRVIDIAFHPQNSNTIYLASPGGGADP